MLPNHVKVYEYIHSSWDPGEVCVQNDANNTKFCLPIDTVVKASTVFSIKYTSEREEFESFIRGYANHKAACQFHS